MVKHFHNSSWPNFWSWWARANILEQLDTVVTRGSSCDTPEPGSSCRDLSSDYENHEDDPYEYDEDIPKLVDCFDDEHVYDGQNDLPARDDALQTSSGSSNATGVTPCWGCKGCGTGSPLFLLGSPAETPYTCTSCQ